MDNKYDWTNIEGIGAVLNQSLYEWWYTGNNRKQFIYIPSNNLIDIAPKVVSNTDKNMSVANGISGKTFVITGAVFKFENRNAAGDYIAARGGKLASSVSKKTDYLVTNDKTSGSSKNKKAAELGVKIISEDELINLGGGL